MTRRARRWSRTLCQRSGFLRFVPAVLLALTAASVAHGQRNSVRDDVDSPGIRIEAAAGWDGHVDRTSPVPISLLIHNDTGRQIEGQLRLSDYISGREVSLGDVVVSPGTSRRVTAIQAMLDWNECYASFLVGTGVAWRRELPINTGSDFSSSLNFAIFVDDGGRRLQLPGETSGTTVYGANDSLLTAGEGRPFRCLSAAGWQLPNHPGPMIPIQALIFPEAAVDAGINDVQWRATAQWMCAGGVVFVHRDSENIVQRLTANSPFVPEPPVREGEFLVRRVGLGAIHAYDQPLLPSDGDPMRAVIGRAVAQLSRQHITNILSGANQQNWRSGRADRNRATVALFFGCYMLLVGVIPLLLFRLSRRRIAAYAIVIVGTASILAGVIGGYLRYSRGDLNWTTIIQAGAGGAVQVGRIEVQSGGGRNTQVAVRGPAADLQFTRTATHYNYWNRPRLASPAFTWQPDLTPDLEDIYQVNVSMTPWGRRTLQATSFQRGVPELAIDVRFEPRNGPMQVVSTPSGLISVPGGRLELTITNTLPVPLKRGWIVIATTQQVDFSTGVEEAVNGMQAQLLPGPDPLQVALAVQAPQVMIPVVELFQQEGLPPMDAGATHSEAIDVMLQVRQDSWNHMIRSDGGYFMPPSAARTGATSAWIFAELNESPMLAIDQPRSDFDPQEEWHLFVQEIRPEDMPDLGPATVKSEPEPAGEPGRQ